MKILQKTVAASLALTALLAMTGCSSSDDGGGSGDSGGSGGSVPLAVGSFNADLSADVGSTYSSLFSINNYAHYQNLYLASEIEGNGYITALKYYYNADEASDVICPNVTIKMGHTTVAGLGSTFSSNVETGAGSLETVLSDTSVVFPQGSVGDSQSITLDTPFYYNGEDNLIIEVENNSSCSTTFDARSSSLVYMADGYTTQSGNDNMLTGTYHPDVTAVFAGGVKTQNYGGTNNNFWPFTQQVPAHIQSLYTATDIDGLGPITGLGFQMDGDSSKQTYTVSVKLGHSTLTDLTDTFVDNSNGLTTVVTDINFTIPEGLLAGEWFWVPLSGSFNYNGVDNLLVDIEVSAGTGDTHLRTKDMSNFVRITAVSGSSTGSISHVGYHVNLRFKGATTDKLQAVSLGGSSSSQVLGQDNNGGQIQSLYKSSDLGTAGKITAIYVRLKNNAQAATVSNHEIFIGHTSKESLNVADLFVDNMEGYVKAYSGTTTIPSTLKAGDWLKLPLDTPYTYDAKDNLIILFSGSTDAINSVRADADSTRYPQASVGREDNAFNPETAQPTWDWPGFVEIRLEIEK